MISQLHPFMIAPKTEEFPWGSPELLRDFADRNNIGVPPSYADTLWQLLDDNKTRTPVTTGQLAGKNLHDLVVHEGANLMGIPYQNAAHFPLQSCIFATGAQQPAKVYPELKGPVQLQNVMATKTGVAKFWYILDAAPHAEVTVGISPRASGQRLRHNLRSPELKNFLQTFRARAGDSYVIPPGIVHSAGRDVVIWEIQLGQQSPLTLSNWHATENVSEEEQQAALKAMSLHPRQTIRRPKSTGTASHSHRLPLTSNFPFFIVEEVRLKDHMFLQTNGKSFDLFFALDGQTLLEFQGDLWTIEKGDFWCVPACLETYKIVTATDSARLLRACMPQ